MFENIFYKLYREYFVCSDFKNERKIDYAKSILQTQPNAIISETDIFLADF